MPDRVKNFYLAIKNDPKLEAKYNAICHDHKKIIELAASEGFHTTEMELVEHMGDDLCLDTLRSPAGERRAVNMAHPCLP